MANPDLFFEIHSNLLISYDVIKILKEKKELQRVVLFDF